MPKSALLVLGALVLLHAGCARRHRTPAQKAESTAWAQPTWGPDAEGLQCRLRPSKRMWHAGQTPTFKLDLRNRGKRILAYVASESVPLDRVSVDGRWYGWPASSATKGKVWPLAPGVEFTDLETALPEEIQSHLTPGRHTIQVAFLFEGVEVVSNPVAIEILFSSQD